MGKFTHVLTLSDDLSLLGWRKSAKDDKTTVVFGSQGYAGLCIIWSAVFPCFLSLPLSTFFPPTFCVCEENVEKWIGNQGVLIQN